MATLFIRTREAIANIAARGYSGDWILTDPVKIAALKSGGTFEAHPIGVGWNYQFLRATITNIVPIPGTNRVVVHFQNAVMLNTATGYSTSWVVKFTP